MQQENRMPLTLQLARWVLRGWMNNQVTAAAVRLAPVFRGYASSYWRNGRGVAQLASDIRRDARWFLVQASWQLASPTDQQVLELASLLIGGVRVHEVQLLADAIIIAGAPKNSPQRKRAEQRAALALGGIAARSLINGI